ncbi:pep-cterm sorting domain-containing protein [Anaeramoeba ignava]|uniref:Pep-cterm sorting domain-containing protein n=1 Tax=Anaeramoeba ignava TaxID=1746090 RepID=A0A9Q0L6J0_ANAIG|nr:pep-cterm sorting domain-containing protein [Anaeramoeba ignava]
METYSNLEKLSNDLKNLFQNQNQNENENENYFDFEIICQKNTKKKPISFKTHKSILSTRSAYFKSMFNSKMKEYQENKLILKDFSSSILSSILNYFYSGKIEINLENAVEILIFSSKYLIDELIQFASQFIKENCQVENVVDLLKICESLNLQNIASFCYQFILDHFGEIVKSFAFQDLEENHLNLILSNDQIMVDEIDIFYGLINWGKHKSMIEKETKDLDSNEKLELKNNLKNILHKIRFIDIQEKELSYIFDMDIVPKSISEKMQQFRSNKIGKKTKNLVYLQKFQEEAEKDGSLIFNSRIRLNSRILKDWEYIQIVRQWVPDPDILHVNSLGFSAQRDGFSSRAFHNACDDKGSTLVFIKTKDGFIFGGFTSVGFKSGSPGLLKDEFAFLFTLKNPSNFPPSKFPIYPDRIKSAVESISSSGPIFGSFAPSISSIQYSDIGIHPNLKRGGSDFGFVYQLPSEMRYRSSESRSFFGGSFSWEIEEIEIYLK